MCRAGACGIGGRSRGAGIAGAASLCWSPSRCCGGPQPLLRLLSRSVALSRPSDGAILNRIPTVSSAHQWQDRIPAGCNLSVISEVPENNRSRSTMLQSLLSGTCSGLQKVGCARRRRRIGLHSRCRQAPQRCRAHWTATRPPRGPSHPLLDPLLSSASLLSGSVPLPAHACMHACNLHRSTLGVRTRVLSLYSTLTAPSLYCFVPSTLHKDCSVTRQSAEIERAVRLVGVAAGVCGATRVPGAAVL